MSISQTCDPAPLVSVIVPAFNAKPFLDQALGSLREQTYGNLEILCLNDGSTDGSVAIMERHAAEDTRVRVIDKANEGYGATCNRGLDEARGAWVAILEPDDWLLPRAFEVMVGAAGEAAEALGRLGAQGERELAPTIVETGSEKLGEAPPLPDMVKAPYWRVLFADTPEQMLVHCYFKGAKAPAEAVRLSNGWAVQGSPAIASCTELMEYHPSIWSALYRADFLRENGIRFLPIPGAGWADNPFLAETMCAARSIAYVDEPFYCYREETPAHFAATIRSQPLLVFDRWHDGADVLERYGDLDDRIVRAHYHRGFNNRDKAAAVLGEDAPLVTKETARMFSRMRMELVLGDPAISPAQKSLFCRMTGEGDYQPSLGERIAFSAQSLGRRIRNVRTVGLRGARAIGKLR